jgi:hypothetical protein
MPETPVTPVTPVTPATPVNPVTPDKPVNPVTPITPAAPDSPVTAWLKTNGASQYASVFDQQGYTDLADLTPDVLKEVLNSEKAPVGVIAKLVRIRTQETNSKPAPTPVAAPDLPAGMTLDLSAHELKGFNGVSFTLPDLGFQSSSKNPGDVISPATALGSDQEKWMAFAKNTAILRGLELNQFFQDHTKSPPRCFKPVLYWMIPKTDSFYSCEQLNAEVTTSIAYTEASSSLVTSGFTGVDAGLSFPFVGASFENQTQSKNSQALEMTKTFIVGTYDFPRVSMCLEDCTVVSTEFVKAITDALAAADPKSALKDVFSDYGHVVGKHVTLGGRLFYVNEKDTLETSQLSSAEETFKGAITLKFEQGSGSSGFANQNGSQSEQAKQALAQSISFSAIGGDTTLVDEPEKWKDTIKAPAQWDVIRYDQLRTTISLLSKDTQEKVMQYGMQILPKRNLPVIDISILTNMGTLTQTEYPFTCVCPDTTRHRILMVYSIFNYVDDDPMGVMIDNTVFPDLFKTQGIAMVDQAVMTVGFINLAPGAHKLTAMPRGGYLPQDYSGQKFVLAPESVTLQAKDFDPATSTNVAVNAALGLWSVTAHNGVPKTSVFLPALTQALPGPDNIGFNFDYSGPAVMHDLQIEYASAECRPVDIILNGILIAPSVANEVTGGYSVDKRVVRTVGQGALFPGTNHLQICRSGAPGPLPAFSEFRFIP